MWMPAHTTVPPGAMAWSAAGTSAPTGAKMIAASSGSGAARSDVPLGDDMRRRAEAVYTQRCRVARHPQRAVADQPGAQQRRRLDVGIGAVDGKTVALVDHRMVGIAAVQRIAGKARRGAQILAPRLAVAALTTGPAQPWDADALAVRVAIDARTSRGHRADHLVARNDRQGRVGQLAVDDVKIGATDAAGMDPDQHLAGPRLGHRTLPQGQRRPRPFQHHRGHRFGHTLLPSVKHH
jgi:hypothetical protein